MSFTGNTGQRVDKGESRVELAFQLTTATTDGLS